MATKQPTEKYLNSAIKTLESNFGANFIKTGLSDYNPKGIPTGYEDLDSVLTRGTIGLYKGGVVEIAGSEGSGKSAFCLRTVGNAQKSGLTCAWFDLESAFDPYFAQIQGVDPEKLFRPELFSKTEKDDEENIELHNCGKIMQMVYKMLISNVFDIIVVDSVAALLASRVLDEDYDPDKTGMATEISRILAQNLGKIAQACEATETTVIFVNQLRDQLNAYIPNKFHTPGGRALKFFAHQRLGMEKIGGVNGKIYVKNDSSGEDEWIGHYAKITILKNRKAAPLPESMVVQVPVYYKEYFPDNAKICYDLGRRLQVIAMRNGVLTWKDDKDIVLQTNGEADFLAELRSKKMEGKLAQFCVKNSKGEKNQSLKNPIRVPSSVVKLAEEFVPAEPEVKEGKKRKGMAPALSLDEK